MGDFSYHSFCRALLRDAIAELKQHDPSFKPSSLTVTKSIIGGYEIQGPDNFYHNASSACCVWSAKAEAVDALVSLHALTERTSDEW